MSVVSLAIVCRFSFIVAVNSLPMYEEGVTMGRMFISVCGVPWHDKLTNCGWQVKAFFMFLMMRWNGYAQASGLRVSLLRSACRIWSSEMIMFYQSACE